MNERVELLRAVQRGMSDIDNWPDDVGYKMLGVNMSKPQNAVVEAVLAAGYRKPRTITTNAELDALPNHSVIVDKDADIWQKRGDEWCSYETNPHISVRLLKYAPLTVIHEGGVA